MTGIILFIYFFSKARGRIENGCLFGSCFKSFRFCTLFVSPVPISEDSSCIVSGDLSFLIFFSSNSCVFSVFCCFGYFGLLMKVTLPIVKGG